MALFNKGGNTTAPNVSPVIDGQVHSMVFKIRSNYYHDKFELDVEATTGLESILSQIQEAGGSIISANMAAVNTSDFMEKLHVPARFEPYVSEQVAEYYSKQNALPSILE